MAPDVMQRVVTATWDAACSEGFTPRLISCADDGRPLRSWTFNEHPVDALDQLGHVEGDALVVIGTADNAASWHVTAVAVDGQALTFHAPAGALPAAVRPTGGCLYAAMIAALLPTDALERVLASIVGGA